MRSLIGILSAACLAHAAIAVPTVRDAARANNSFGFGLFQKVEKRTEKGNKFLSPVSAYFALSMLYNGAESKTAQQMQQVLGAKAFGLKDLNAANQALLDDLTSRKGLTLKIANSLWARDGLSLRPAFQQRVESAYHAVTRALDFNLPEASVTINGWVKKNTGDKITKIVDDSIDPTTVLFLINATYFEAQWKEKFDQRMTYPSPFFVPTKNGSREQQVPMMFREGEMSLVQEGGTKIVKLPYEGDTVDFVLVLPPPGQSPDAYAAKLDASKWDALLSRLDTVPQTNVFLRLPKLEIEYGSELNDALKALGMPRAFGPAAELQGLAETNGHLYLSKVKQKTYVQVDEKGTKAAAATSAEVGLESMPMGTEVTVDHPYLVAIRDRKSNAILFLGSINEPELGKSEAGNE